MTDTLPSIGAEPETLAAGSPPWARGRLPDEAAVKLLVDTGMLRKVAHLAPTDNVDRTWFDWDEVVAWYENDR